LNITYNGLSHSIHLFDTFLTFYRHLPALPAMAHRGFVYVLPMPTPGSPTAPYFKGRHVTDFLDSLEAHATAANLPLNDLPGYVLRYCHLRVRNIIESSTHWTQHNWTAARSHLIDLYGSSDRKPRISSDRLRKWVGLHAETSSISRLQDVDRYYREFTAQSTPLLAASLITTHEANLLFYRGIPSKSRKKIKRKIPEAHQTATSPPSIASILGCLRDQFDIDGIEDDSNDVRLAPDSDSDSDTNDDLDVGIKSPRSRKKKVKFDAKHVPTGSTAMPQISTALDALAKELHDQIQTVKAGQEAMLREIATIGTPMTPSRNPTYEKSCFICDLSGTHVIGPRDCPEVPILINEGLASFNQVG
jgi:hypothetical protein